MGFHVFIRYDKQVLIEEMSLRLKEGWQSQNL